MIEAGTTRLTRLAGLAGSARLAPPMIVAVVSAVVIAAAKPEAACARRNTFFQLRDVELLHGRDLLRSCETTKENQTWLRRTTPPWSVQITHLYQFVNYFNDTLTHSKSQHRYITAPILGPAKTWNSWPVNRNAEPPQFRVARHWWQLTKLGDAGSSESAKAQMQTGNCRSSGQMTRIRSRGPS